MNQRQFELILDEWIEEIQTSDYLIKVEANQNSYTFRNDSIYAELTWNPEGIDAKIVMTAAPNESEIVFNSEKEDLDIDLFMSTFIGVIPIAEDRRYELSAAECSRNTLISIIDEELLSE